MSFLQKTLCDGLVLKTLLKLIKEAEIDLLKLKQPEQKLCLAQQ